MFKAPQCACPAESRLDLVTNQQRLAARAPLAQRFHIRFGCERGAAALVSLQHHARDGRRLDAALAQRSFEAFERYVARAEPVGERDLDEAGIEVYDPRFELRYSSGLLRSQR